MKIRKKPITVDAWVIDLMEMQYQGELPFWVYRAWKEDKVIATSSDGHDMILRIKTEEGIMTAHEGDVLVRGIKGELYAIKRSIFDATYDVVDAENKTDPTSRQEEVKEAVESLADGEITITDFTDLPDGSAICAVNMTSDTLMRFARIGLLKTIEDACDRAEALIPDSDVS